MTSGQPRMSPSCPPKGCVALDIDDPQSPASAFLLSALSDAPLQATGRVGGGYHVFVRGVEGMSEDLNGATVKGNAGGYVVMTPSEHISGGVYAIIRGGEVLSRPAGGAEGAQARRQRSATEPAEDRRAAHHVHRAGLVARQVPRWGARGVDDTTLSGMRWGTSGTVGRQKRPRQRYRDLVSHALEALVEARVGARGVFAERFDRAWKYDIAHPERIEAVRKRRSPGQMRSHRNRSMPKSRRASSRRA